MKRIVDWTCEIAEINQTKDGQRALYLPADWTTKREDILNEGAQAVQDDSDGVVSGGR